MADIVVFGTGANAELAHFYFGRDSAHRVVAFVVDGSHLREDHFCGLPVVATETIPPQFRADRCSAFVATGYGKINRLRAEKCAAMQAAGYELVSYINSNAIVMTDHPMGWNCFILEGVAIQPFVRIGNDVQIWPNSTVAHGTTIDDHAYLSGRVTIAGEVHVGTGCFLGIGSTVRDRVRLGRNCVVGAGAVILGDTEDDAVYTAPPARKLPTRSDRLRRI